MNVAMPLREVAFKREGENESTYPARELNGEKKISEHGSEKQ